MSYANEKYLSAGMTARLGVSVRIQREQRLRAAMLTYIAVSAQQSREILLINFNDAGFILMNNSGDPITDYLGGYMKLFPNSGVFIKSTISADATRYRLASAIMNYGVAITAAVMKHRLMNSDIDYAVGFTGTQNKYGNLNSQILSKAGIEGILTRLRLGESEIYFSSSLNSVLMKRIGTFNTIIIKFKE
jgi:hypothetical protein